MEDSLNDMCVLPFAYTVSEHNNLLWLDLHVTLEDLDMAGHHIGKVLYDLPGHARQLLPPSNGPDRSRAAFLQSHSWNELRIIAGDSANSDRDGRLNQTAAGRRMSYLS